MLCPIPAQESINLIHRVEIVQKPAFHWQYAQNLLCKSPVFIHFHCTIPTEETPGFSGENDTVDIIICRAATGETSPFFPLIKSPYLFRRIIHSTKHPGKKSHICPVNYPLSYQPSLLLRIPCTFITESGNSLHIFSLILH